MKSGKWGSHSAVKQIQPEGYLTLKQQDFWDVEVKTDETIKLITPQFSLHNTRVDTVDRFPGFH